MAEKGADRTLRKGKDEEKRGKRGGRIGRQYKVKASTPSILSAS